MPSAKELAKALAYRGEIRNTPQNSFLGGVANFLSPVSEFADRDKLPGSIPLLGGMSFADLSGLKGAQSLVNDMSYGTPPIRGASLQTAKVDPRVLDLAGVSGAMIPVGKALGKAALREGARQIETGTGVLGSKVIDPRQRMFAGEGAKTADHGALKVAKDMKAAGVPDEQIHAKTKWTFAFADGKPRFEIDDSAAKLRIMPRANQMLKAQTVDDFMAHPELLSAHPDLAKTDIRLSRSESGSKGAYLPEQNTIELAGLSDTAPYSMANDVKSTTLHELQHAIQQREGFARGGSPEMFMRGYQNKLKDLNSQVTDINQQMRAVSGTPQYDELMNARSGIVKQIQAIEGRDGLGALEAANKDYRRLAGEAEARLTQARMNMTAPERAASYPPSMFDVPVKDQIVRYGDNVGGAMMQRPKTEFEILHDTAQRNAALPKEQGGLGLPEGNAAMDRAKAMGFDTPAYHGTNADIKEFDLSKHGTSTDKGDFGKAVYVSTDNAIANNYANAKDMYGKDISGANVMPLSIKENNAYPVNGQQGMAELIKKLGGEDAWYDLQQNPDKYANAIKDLGYDSVRDYGYKQSAVFNPANIRSRFAAFDPMRRHEADILAGVGVGGMLDPQAIAEALRQQDRK